MLYFSEHAGGARSSFRQLAEGFSGHQHVT